MPKGFFGFWHARRAFKTDMAGSSEMILRARHLAKVGPLVESEVGARRIRCRLVAT
jgi:hypothetical protein